MVVALVVALAMATEKKQVGSCSLEALSTRPGMQSARTCPDMFKLALYLLTQHQLPSFLQQVGQLLPGFLSSC